MKTIIGTIGKKGSGKTLTRDYLLSFMKADNIKAEKFSFSTPIKKIAHELFGIPYNVLYGEDSIKGSYFTEVPWENVSRLVPKYKDKEGALTVRELLQILGTEIFRDGFDYDIWVNALIRSIMEDDCEVALIDDCRFLNEIKSLSERHSIFLRLKRVAQNANADKHASETSLDSIDWSEFNTIEIPEGEDLKNYKDILRGIYKNNILPFIKEDES